MVTDYEGAKGPRALGPLFLEDVGPPTSLSRPRCFLIFLLPSPPPLFLLLLILLLIRLAPSRSIPTLSSRVRPLQRFLITCASHTSFSLLLLFFFFWFFYPVSFQAVAAGMHNAFKDRVIATDYAVARASFSAKGVANLDPQTVTRPRAWSCEIKKQASDRL